MTEYKIMPAAPTMRLKPLVWNNTKKHSEAECFGGHYIIHREIYGKPISIDGVVTTKPGFYVIAPTRKYIGVFDTEDEAKAATEAHRERLMMEMWETGDE